MKNFNKICSIVVITFFLIGCAASPASIKPTYVSPLKYRDYNCDQLQQEYDCLNKKLAEITKAQKSAATTDAVSMGIGMILFWPALFIIAFSGDHEVELAQLKGDYEAIRTLAIKKNCSGLAEVIKAKQEKGQKEQKEKIRKNLDPKTRDW